MNLGEMIEKIGIRTKRPDKRDDTIDAINNAISFFSLGASFAQDLVEGTLNIVSTDYAQSFSIADNFTRFRRLKYLKRTGQRGFLRKIDAQRTYTANGCAQTDVWYRAGDNIVINMKALASSLEYGYYQYPLYLDGTDEEAEHWMLEVYPLMIFNKACAEVFAAIGDATEDVRRHETLANVAFETLRQDLEDGGTEENS